MCKEICMDAAARMPENQNVESKILSVEEARIKIAATIGAAPEEIILQQVVRRRMHLP